MSVNWADVVWGFLVPAPLSAALKVLFQCVGVEFTFWSGWLCGGLGGVAGYGLEGEWVPAAGGALNAVVAVLAWWWWTRRRRKRAAKLIGAKTRAILAAMARNLRQRAQPRPALRPVPGAGGAR